MKKIYYLSLILLTCELPAAYSFEPKTAGQVLDNCRRFNPKLYAKLERNKELLLLLDGRNFGKLNNTFQAGHKEELSEFELYLQQKYPQINPKEFTNLMNDESEEQQCLAQPFSELHKHSESYTNLYYTFNYLKHKMNISQDVSLWKKKSKLDTNNSYKSISRAVNLSSYVVYENASLQLFSLIHELTHAKQHQQIGIVKFVSCYKPYIECQADTHAICAIKCPVCSQLIADNYTFFESQIQESEFENFLKKGYLSGGEIERLSGNKSMQDLCCAHKVDTPGVRKLVDLVRRRIDLRGLLLDGDDFSEYELLKDTINDCIPAGIQLFKLTKENCTAICCLLLDKKNPSKLSDYLSTVSFEK